MKKALALVLIFVLALALVACASEEPCTHQWGEAYCSQHPVCTLCGEESADVQDHTWQPATMDAPRTCSVCKVTDGEPLSLEGTWEGTAYFFPIYFGIETANNRSIQAKMVLVLDAEKNMKLSLEYNKENYDSCMTENFIAMICSNGASQEELDAQYLAEYGMTVEEYAAVKALESAPENYKEEYTYTYYLNDNQLLYGEHSENLDRYYRFSLKENKLTLQDTISDMVYDLTKAS